MSETLTERRAAILGLVVDEYVDRATPVSSRALLDRHRLGVSAATVRNELAKLEEAGYVTHPYTSAGRVPSDSGYRLYVEELMAEDPIGTAEQRTIEHQFHQTAADLEQWLRLAASILAGSVGNVAIVSRPRGRLPALRQVQLVQLHADSALLVAVMEDGRVQQRVVAFDVPTTQHELTEWSTRLNQLCAGMDASTIVGVSQAVTGTVDEPVVAAIAELLEAHLDHSELYVDGLRSALEQPEFSSADRMLDAVRHLEEYHLRRAIAKTVEIDFGSTRIVIGAENAQDWLRDWTIVASTFGDGDRLRGTVAVLGPTRMHYGRTIPRVQYVASLMTSLLRAVALGANERE